MRKDQKRYQKKEKPEYEQKIIDIARVTRVMKGGKRMSFRACVVIGNQKGKIGMGVKKGADVTIAINKAVDQAKKNLITVPVKDETLPHDIIREFCGARVMMKPAPKGSGIVAGGVLRPVFELAGVRNVVSKIMGSKGKINNIRAAMKALSELKTEEHYKKIKEL